MVQNIIKKINKIISKKQHIAILLFSFMFILLILRLFNLQIINGYTFRKNFNLKIQKEIKINSTRGNIYDCNGKLLAYDKLSYDVKIEDDGRLDYLSNDEKNNKLNSIIFDTITSLEKNNDTILYTFKIKQNSDGKYYFDTASNIEKNRFLADIYGKISIDELSDEQLESTAEDIIDYLSSNVRYNIDKKYSPSDKLKIINTRYAMTLNRFSKYIDTYIAKNISEKSVAYISENTNKLIGISVIQGSMRFYNDSKYFSSIIGYTGKISEGEYNNLSKSVKNNYSINDTIGKAGIEKNLDIELQGVKGSKTLFLDSTGNTLKVSNEINPSPGNDVFLTIDSELQMTAYDLIERKLTEIILPRIINVINYDKSNEKDTKDIKIPIGEIYSSFFSNSLIDINDMANSKDGTTSKYIYNIFLSYKEKITNELINELKSSTKNQSNYSSEMKDYSAYIIDEFLVNHNIILLDKLPKDDNMYKAWNNSGDVKVSDLLNYYIANKFISKNFISKSKYQETSEIVNKICKYINNNLEYDLSFSRLILKHMVYNEVISGKQICLIAIEQGYFNENTDTILKINSGERTAYDYLYGKIADLELTPGEMGIEPCSGSCIITDPNTGKVKACVSYPGYDNNKLSNYIDQKYYNKLISHNSRPLYNHATQESFAPGSTYKMVSATAGLQTFVINSETYHECNGEFERISPHPKCWIYPDGHGYQNVVGAITNSCNMFFYNTAYDFSYNNHYDDNKGIEILKKYASKFGLDKKSGIELEETMPIISEKDAIRSAIGQGYNSFTASSLSVYISCIANKGEIYNLSLLDKITNSNKDIIKSFIPSIRNKTVDIADSTWDMLETGMVEMCNAHQSFTTNRANGILVAGKTGTSQQSSKHPDNGQFVGYLLNNPNNLNYSFVVRMANSYGAVYSADICADLCTYVTGYITREELLKRGILSSNNYITGD